MKPELNNIIIANNWPESFNKLHPKCQMAIVAFFFCFSVPPSYSENNSGKMEICSVIDFVGEVPHELLLIITKMMMMLWPKEELHLQYYTKPEEKTVNDKEKDR